MHTHMLFSRSYTLLCALETAHTPYTIYFALIHHCTNSLSSLHIFVHHCTFCASLYTKTSPAILLFLLPSSFFSYSSSCTSTSSYASSSIEFSSFFFLLLVFLCLFFSFAFFSFFFFFFYVFLCF